MPLRVLTAAVLVFGTLASPLAAQFDGLRLHAVAHAPDAPRILVADVADSDRVALRVSVPLNSSVDALAAAPILLRLANQRIRGLADALGLRIEFGRSAHALSYSVAGPAVEIDQLAYLLRMATRDPGAAAGFGALRAEEVARLTRLAETGEGQLEARLRVSTSGGDPDAEQVRDRQRTLSVTDLRRVWRELHAPAQMSVVVIGKVDETVLLAALSGLGEADPAPTPPDASRARTPSPARGDLLRRWYGGAWTFAPALDARTAVVAALASRRLRSDRADFEAWVRVWEGRSADRIAVFGAAFERGRSAMTRAVDGWIGAVLERLNDDEVRDVARRLSFELQVQARTPWGRAHLVGRFIEAGLPPDAAADYLSELDRVDAAGIRAYLEPLQTGAPVTARVGR